MMPETRVAIAGLGAIGRTVARRLADGIPGLSLACAAARDVVKAKAWLDKAKIACPLVELTEFPRYADLAVECAPAEILESICTPMLTAGKRVMVLSAGALLPRPHLTDLARQHGGEIIVPTGALLGLDAVRAAAEGRVDSVTIESRKPPRGREGAPYLVKHGIDVSGLNAPRRVFEGNAFDAAAGFPANVNVAAALALAGIGPTRTRVEIWADPGIDRNTHTIRVEADAARFTMTIENVPSEENPRTGRITALSMLACLRGLVATLKVGT
jgi:aspartate dehydrogenase